MATNKKENKTGKGIQLKGTPVPKDTFEVDGKKYKFTVGKYIIPGRGPVLVTEALKDVSELERLVEVNAGVISLAQ